MINPRELRIGNLVYREYYSIDMSTEYLESIKVFQVSKVEGLTTHNYINSIWINTIKYEYNDSSKIDDISPIPITEEWLLRLGFINNDFLPSGSYYLNGLSIEVEENITTVFIKTLEIDVKYIHQLQNLYFDTKYYLNSLLIRMFIFIK